MRTNMRVHIHSRRAQKHEQVYGSTMFREETRQRYRTFITLHIRVSISSIFICTAQHSPTHEYVDQCDVSGMPSDGVSAAAAAASPLRLMLCPYVGCLRWIPYEWTLSERDNERAESHTSGPEIYIQTTWRSMVERQCRAHQRFWLAGWSYAKVGVMHNKEIKWLN